jgi:hypothetical protein
MFLAILIGNIVLNYTHTSLTEFIVLYTFRLYLPDDGVLHVEICRKDIGDTKLLIVDCAVCWIKYSIINPLHRILIT